MKTYNFIEAVNSGRRFRRVKLDPRVKGDQYIVISGKLRHIISPGNYVASECIHNLDFINDQFEIEENKITITEDVFEGIHSKIWDLGLGYKNELKEYKKELGF